MSREANSLMPETGLWPARPAGRPRGGPSAPAITKPGSDSPTCPPAALRSRRAPGHRARGGGQLKRKVPGTPGSRCGAARPPVPERSTSSGRAAAARPARSEASPPGRSTHPPPPPPPPPRAPRAAAGPVREGGGGVSRPAACPAAAGTAPPARHVTRPRPLAARLAAAAGSAGPHWPGGGARAGAPGLHNRRRVGGGEGPGAPYITPGSGGGRRSANPGSLARTPGRRGPEDARARAPRVECPAHRRPWSQRGSDRALRLPVTRRRDRGGGAGRGWRCLHVRGGGAGTEAQVAPEWQECWGSGSWRIGMPVGSRKKALDVRVLSLCLLGVPWFPSVNLALRPASFLGEGVWRTWAVEQP